MNQIWLALLLLGCLTSLADSISLKHLFKDEWEAYKLRYGKEYENDVEERFRMKIYLDNRRKISKHNRAKNSFSLELNEFGDLLTHELITQRNGFRAAFKVNGTDRMAGRFVRPANTFIPESFDWRDKGAVTNVKNQGKCASCYCFAAIGSLEGQFFLKNVSKQKEVLSLSEQNLVDCSSTKKYGNKGCAGGLMSGAFTYIRDNDGVDTEASYPYTSGETGKNDTCRYNVNNKGADDIGFINILSGSEEHLLEAVATVGPIAAAIDGSQPTFGFFKNGIYFDPNCKSETADLSHAVLIVGYGRENSEDGEKLDYWLVKNSWGKDWGDNGYIKMARNRDNNCGIATMASYPVV